MECGAVRPMSHLRLYHATSSSNLIASTLHCSRGHAMIFSRNIADLAHPRCCRSGLHCRRSLWAGQAVARSVFMPNGQAVLLALPLSCLQMDFSSISYWIDSYNHARISKNAQNSKFSQSVVSFGELHPMQTLHQGLHAPIIALPL